MVNAAELQQLSTYCTQATTLANKSFLTTDAGIGRGINVFGPQMALAEWINAISKGSKKSRFPGPNPLPLALVMDLPASKQLRI
jgi:hypothetical protein